VIAATVAALGALTAEQRLLPPERQLTARILITAIDWYRDQGSERLRSHTGIRCRFDPTCSRFARAAILEHGSVAGIRMTTWRLVRCGPWTPQGTSDPVPPRVRSRTEVQSP
jgi:putative membrane protein insertion efficiency factor